MLKFFVFFNNLGFIKANSEAGRDRFTFDLRKARDYKDRVEAEGEANRVRKGMSYSILNNHQFNG